MESEAHDSSGLADRQWAESQVPIFRFDALESGLAAWCDVAAALFDCYPVSSPASRSELTVLNFRSFLLCRSMVDRGRYSRDVARLTSDGLDHIVVSCVMDGRISTSAPKGNCLRSGDVAVLDLSCPATFSVLAADALHIIVPRLALPPAVAPVYPVPVRRFSRKTAIASFICGIMESLWEASSCMNSVEMSAFGMVMPEMLGWLLGTAVPASSALEKVDLGRRLRRHIEQNLHLADLGPKRLLRDVGISRSQLYRQFEKSGGVEAYIRQRRLRRSLIALSDPHLADRRIGDIAFDVGFGDEAHFSRLFRQTFGRSPRNVRNSIRSASSGAQGDLGRISASTDVFAQWLSMLGRP